MKNNILNTQYSYPKSWIIGFSEGEITFGLSITGKKIKCYISLPQDERDLNVLNNLKQQLNCGFIYKDTGDRKVWYYKVTSLKELSEIIIPLFEKHPLLTTKNFDLQDFKTVIEIMLKGDHLTNKGFNKIKYIHANINTKRNRINLNHNIPKIIDPYWLVGLIDAEGNFYCKVTPNKTSKLGYRVITSFSIAQRAIELPVFEFIKNYLNCGYIVINKARINKGLLPMMEYKIAGLKDLTDKLIPFLNSYPLKTSKLNDYNKFKTIVEMCNKKEHLTINGLNKIRSLIPHNEFNRKKYDPQRRPYRGVSVFDTDYT